MDYSPLKWVVECKPGIQVFWEPIAAFNVESVARAYLRECLCNNGYWAQYRIVEVKNV